MRKFKFLALIVAASIFVVSCQKGDAGPAGPAGANGATGAAGANGAKGDKGDPGTANIYYSSWFTVQTTKDTVAANTYVWYAAIPDTLVNDNILNKGMVKVYANVSNNSTNTVVQDAEILGITVLLIKGGIYLEASGDFSTLPLRYVIIPGGTPASNSVDWKNYAKVQEFLHIQN